MQTNRLKYQKKQLLILFVLLLFVITFVIIFARYVTNNVSDFFVRSKEFYFYSDKLEENTAVYQIDNWTGVDPYPVHVKMNSSLNNLKFASYDIDYTASAQCTTGNATCQLSKLSGTIPSGSNSTHSDQFTVTITPTVQLNTGDEVTVLITATSNNEYVKELKGLFTLVVGKEDLTYEITDSVGDPYCELRLTNTLSYYIVRQQFTVGNQTYTVDTTVDADKYLSFTPENRAKCASAIVTISFNPNQVLFDLTNEAYQQATNVGTRTINGDTYVDSFTIKIDAISSKILRFYKVDPSQDYTYPKEQASCILNITSN